MNFDDIRNKLNNILETFINKNRNIINITDNYLIILKILSTLEIIDKIFFDKKLNDNVFEYINDLKSIANTKTKIVLNNIIIILNDDNLFNCDKSSDTSNLSRYSSFSSNDSNSFCYLSITEQIKNMLELDSKIINEITEPINQSFNNLKDVYGDITPDMITDAKILFDKIDKNNDNIITPIDINEIVKSIKTCQLSFNSDIIIDIIQYFVTYQKSIDIYSFIHFIAYIE
jgi:hypothetical protein